MCDDDLLWGLVLGAVFMAVILLFLVILPIHSGLTDQINEGFCQRTFGEMSEYKYMDKHDYCQKINSQGELAMREIIKVDNKWIVKDGILPTQKEMN